MCGSLRRRLGLIRVAVPAIPHDKEKTPQDPHRHLEMLLWLLGETEGGQQMFDFLESSSWPVRSIDVELNLELAKLDPPPRFVRFTGLREPRPPEVLARLPVHPLPPAAPAPPAARGPLRLAVFGVHGATSLDPATAIRAAWHAYRGQGEGGVTMRFYGHPCPGFALTGYLCAWSEEMLPMYGSLGDGGVAEVLLGMVDVSASHAERPWDVQQAVALLAATHARDSFLREADLWLCSGPAVLCSLLHGVVPAKPMIIWHCRHLADGLMSLHNETRVALLTSIRSMLVGSSGVAMVACEAFASIQESWQLGLPLCPVHRRLALYAEHFAWKANKPGGRPEQILVLRSMIWSKVPGLYFRTLLEAFVRENRAEFRYRFTFAADATDGKLLPYSEMALHRCAVLVPNDLTMAAFVEAFTMGIPIFLPTDVWLYRLQKAVPYGFMVHGGQLPMESETESETKEYPPPFWQEKTRQRASVLYWLRTSDFSTWPHVQRFASIPELLDGVANADVRALSRAMRRWQVQGSAEVLPRWRGLVETLLGGEKGARAAEGGPKTATPPGPPVATVPSRMGSAAAASLGDRQLVPRADVLYAALACEHHSFDAAGWPEFRAMVEENTEGNFPVNGALYEAAGVMLAGLPRMDEALVHEWARALHSFLAEATKSTLMTEEAILRLGGRCHMGIATALMLRARHELEADDDKVALVLAQTGRASELLGPLQNIVPWEVVPIPYGVWPAESLMNKIGALMDEGRRRHQG